MLDQQAAKRGADDKGKAVAACPDAEGAAALARVGPYHANDGERGRQQQGSACSGGDTGGDQDADAGGECAGDRRGGEDAGAHLEHAPAAVEISEEASREQENCISQVVAVQHPLQRGDGGTECQADRVHGQVDHGSIDLCDQHTEA